MRARAVALFVSVICSGTVALAAGPTTKIASFPFTGQWGGGAYADSQTGQFSYCVAGVPYRSGIYMMVSVDRNFDWALGFSDSSWTLKLDQTIPLVANFDGGPQWALTGYPTTPHSVRVPMADNSNLINDFRGAYTMSVRVYGENFGFDLTNTSELIPELVQCVRTELAGTPAQPSSPVAAARAPGVPSANPANGTSSELEAVRIASNLLLAAKLPNAHLLSPSQTPAGLRDRGVAWTSDDGSGAVELLPSAAGQDPQSIGSQLIGIDASSCKGDFGSGRSSALVGDKVVTKVFTACKDPESSAVFRYFIIKGTGGEFIVYSLFGNADTTAESAPLADPPFQAAAVAAAYTP